MRMLLALPLLLIAPLAQANASVITDGNSLAAGLKAFEQMSGGKPATKDQEYLAAAAAAYVAGFLGACAMWEKLSTNCPLQLPKTGVPTDQAIKIVQQFLHEHPEELNSSANALCFVALANAFTNRGYEKPSDPGK